MRIARYIFLSFISITTTTLAAQIPLHSSSSGGPTTASINLIDALSADPDYTSLLRLLQRARLIPTLNKLNGSTFFAPTNDAIERHRTRSALWHIALHDGVESLKDNIQEQLRQELFYHLLNYTIPAQDGLEVTEVQVHKTLHFPRTLVEPPPSEDPVPAPPWLPLPGGSLGGEPQRVRLASRGEDGAWVGVDAFGVGGVEIIKGRVNVSNGVLLGVDNVLPVPPDLATVISQHPSTKYFDRILTPEISSLLNGTEALTVFLPVNEAWDSLDYWERLYLESDHSTDDLIKILSMHAVIHEEDKVTWSEEFDPGVNLTTVHGSTLEVVKTPERILVSSSTLVQSDVYASNGVLHLVDSLLVPPGSLALTPEKFLLVANCTSFVSLLNSVNLTGFINTTHPHHQYTILAPQNDILNVFGGEENLPPRGSEELKRMLQYHFLPGRWSPSKLKDGMLVKTELVDGRLGNDSQVLGVEVESKGDEDKDKIVRFGGAGTIGDPVEINNTLIYFISRPLVPPSDALQTALPKLELSSFLAAVFSTSLADKLKKTASTTLLIPNNKAFTRIGGLVSDHLLAASSKADLEKVILHHVIDGVHYAHEIENSSQWTFPTLEGSDIQLDKHLKQNRSALITASGGWSGMLSELYTRNMLTATGVVHQLSDLLIPRSVDLTVGKLVKAAKGTTMITLVNKVGMDWVLNGTAPPEGSQWAEARLDVGGWTLLCPTDDAFKKFNLTQLYEDTEGLAAIVSQHLIPIPRTGWLESEDASVDNVLNNNRPLQLDESPTYSTLMSASSAYGDVTFRPASSEDEKKHGTGYLVGIKGARGTDGKADWATVLSWGRSTTGSGQGGVIQIDRLLIPYRPPWWIEYGGPAVVGVGGTILICVFFWCVRLIWRRDTTEATYEPAGGFGRDDDA